MGVAVKASRLALCVGLLLCSVLVLSCGQVKITEAPQTFIASEAAPLGRPEHDLAVLGAEMNPQLDGVLRAPRGAATFQLLVAVENRGTQPERDVIVEAWLESDGDQILLTSKTIVPYVAPGEVAVARLSATGVIAIMPCYVMTVSVRPVPFETYVGNNTSEYEIAVSAPVF